MIKILQKNEESLRKISKEVPIKEINSPKIQKIIQQMKEAMNSQNDALALAAPQIGINLRIFVVSRKLPIFLNLESGKQSQELSKELDDDLVFINPKIIKQSKKKNIFFEGCLSVRGWWGNVKRSTNVTIEAYNEKGEKIVKGSGGLLAQIFQHEIDHLNGILFIDKAENLTKDERKD